MIDLGNQLIAPRTALIVQALATALLTLFASFAKAEDGSHAFDEMIVLTGTVSLETFAGPPNFESTVSGDKPLHYWVLHLPRTLAARSASKGSLPQDKTNVVTTRDLQLLVSEAHRTQLKSMNAGSTVTVRGKLFEPVTGYHMTPILIDVIHIASP